jgi:hypothetical protein
MEFRQEMQKLPINQPNEGRFLGMVIVAKS